VRGLEDELDADEAEDDGQADRQVDEPVEQPVEQEVQLRRPSSANALAVKTMYGSLVRPKIAGMESSANRMSVEPIAIMTSSSGVATRLPSTR
jgi:hypothetical protein